MTPHPSTTPPVLPPLDLPVIDKGRHLNGPEAVEFWEKVVKAYTVRRATIGEIALASNRSEPEIRQLLAEADVRIEPRRQPCGAPRPASQTVSATMPGTNVHLTRREEQALRHIAAGLTTAEAATAMEIAPVTLQVFLNKILRKLNASSRAAAVEIAYAAELLPQPPREATEVDLPPRLLNVIPLVTAGACGRTEELSELMQRLNAHTRPHIVTRARQHRLPTSLEGISTNAGAGPGAA